MVTDPITNTALTSEADSAHGPTSSGLSTEARRQLFGASYEQVATYAAMLEDQGVLRGLIGPREVPRLWERHIVNSAAVVPFLPSSGSVLDLGSGAGLPGIVLAAMRPDLQVTLLEPMERRVTWLREVVQTVGLPQVTVLRGRAEDVRDRVRVDVVTARAVAPMDRLAGWALPLLTVGGVLLALKGSRARDELREAREALTAWGGDHGEVLTAPTTEGVDPTLVVRVRRASAVSPPQKASRSRRR